MNVVFGFKWVAKRFVEVNRIDIVSPNFGDGDVASVNQFVNYAVHRSFSNANQLCDFAEAHIWILCNAHQHVGVVRKECPVLRVLSNYRLFWHEYMISISCIVNQPFGGLISAIRAFVSEEMSVASTFQSSGT